MDALVVGNGCCWNLSAVGQNIDWIHGSRILEIYDVHAGCNIWRVVRHDHFLLQAVRVQVACSCHAVAQVQVSCGNKWG